MGPYTLVYLDDVVQARIDGISVVPRVGDGMVLTINGRDVPAKVEDVIWLVVPNSFAQVSVYAKRYR